jgi:hypothetical protein
MTSATYSRRLALLATLASSLWLAACGGGGGDGGGSANLRAINLTTDLPSADIFTGDTKRFSALATDALASNVSVEAATYTINVKVANDAAALYTGSFSLSKDQNYTAVVWGRQASLRVSTIGEAEDSAGIADGNTRVRMFNATLDSGTVDVYVTTSEVDLNDVPPTQATLTAGTLAGFRELTAKTYRIRVTGPGDPNDVRLDIPAVVLANKKFYTLVLTQAGNGGVLLNGTLIEQQGDRVSAKNNKARVRLAASVAGGGLVSASIGGAPVFTNYRSPRVLGSGGYAQVDGGDVNVTINVNGANISNSTQTLAKGGDYTLLAYGSAASPQFKLVPDDNRLPSTITRAKLRLVNGLDGTDLTSLLLDSQSFAQTSDIASGFASTYASVTALGTAQIQVTSAQVTAPLFTQTVASTAQSLLTAQGVYTVFILGGGDTPAGRLTKDR